MFRERGPGIRFRCYPEKDLVPNPPTHGTAAGIDGRAPFQARNATILGKVARKAMVMEHGIKSPSLCNGDQGRPDAGPKANTVGC